MVAARLPLTGPASPRRSVCAPGAIALSLYADLPTKEPLMIPSLWSRRGRGQRPAPRGRARQQRSRLYLEPLEDRCLLSTYTPGPLVEVSSPDPLASYPPGPKGAIGAGEPDVAVNPANPKNIAAIWIDHGFADNVVGVTLDGGKTWQNVPLPLTQ